MECPTLAVIILLKLNHTVHNSCPGERAHQEQTCPQDIQRPEHCYNYSILNPCWMFVGCELCELDQ